MTRERTEPRAGPEADTTTEPAATRPTADRPATTAGAAEPAATRATAEVATPATGVTAEAATAATDRAEPVRPLQNRVDPFGVIFRSAARGLVMGNRGGRIHEAGTQSLDARRRWASRAWICCETEFRDRARTVWGESYTELFFLDEVTALAAGHRPCFECRRRAATDFAEAFARGNGLGEAPAAGHIDKVLHAERLDPDSPGGRGKKLYVAFVDTLPDGAVIASDEPMRRAWAIKGGYVLPWSADGWGRPLPRPRRRLVTLVTPPSTVMALKAGYRPLWHPSAATETFERRFDGAAA